MKLDEFIAGSIYIDTNILYMYLRADLTYLPVIKSFLVRIVKGEIQAFISIPVLDELYYRLLLARINGNVSLASLHEFIEISYS